MKALAAIISGLLAAAIGVTSTYLVMTKGLEYYQETKVSIYDEGDGADKAGGGMKAKMGGKGGKGGKGKGKGMPNGQENKGGQEGKGGKEQQ
jgi:hypothetical protein